MTILKDISLILILFTFCLLPNGFAADEGKADQSKNVKNATVILATTTSTHDSGLLDLLIPEFEKQSGYKIKTVAVGTGQALALGRMGEADLLLVHAPELEKKLVTGGYGHNRRAVMHNDFIIVGPKEDPAGINGEKDPAKALEKIMLKKAEWVSRADRSGTNVKELALWNAEGLAPSGDWYLETGQGMGATLRIASERRAYTLSDRGTFYATANLELKILVEGNPILFNPYHVIEVKGKHINAPGAKALAEFLVSPRIQKMIGEFKRDGRVLFFPDALESAK